MNIYLFGKTSLSGEAFYKYFNFKKPKHNIYSFSRDQKKGYKLDLKIPNSFSVINNDKFILISFSPIWDLADFLNYLFYHENSKLINLKGIIACSSTSALTKRFESNAYDKNLAKKLLRSEKEIISIAEKLNINCQIIRPTMIYGSFNEIKDNNISKILYIMRTLKIVFIPSNSGLRQPIHAYQLAEVVYFLMLKSLKAKTKVSKNIINLGGDVILNYQELIESLKNSVGKNDAARKCLILKIPNRFFLVSILPVMIFSPKSFAALSRICSNLSGFKKAYEITRNKPKSFPCLKDFK
tara:strand:- start:795 stop:1685 length:891 start_codon:yes stop_codon:yes gene_type:complete